MRLTPEQVQELANACGFFNIKGVYYCLPDELSALIEEVQKQTRDEYKNFVCLECGGDPVIANIARRMGHRPDIAYVECMRLERQLAEANKKLKAEAVLGDMCIETGTGLAEKLREVSNKRREDNGA